MTDELRFAAAFAADIREALAARRAVPATAELAGSLGAACTARLATALEGRDDASAWCALWRAVADAVAFAGVDGNGEAIARLRAFLNENADLTGVRLAPDAVVTLGERHVLTFVRPPEPVAQRTVETTVEAPGSVMDLVLCVWSFAAFGTGVLLAARALTG